MTNEQFMNLMKDLIKEEVKKRQALLEHPRQRTLDEVLTEGINKILNRGAPETK